MHFLHNFVVRVIDNLKIIDTSKCYEANHTKDERNWRNSSRWWNMAVTSVLLNSVSIYHKLVVMAIALVIMQNKTHRTQKRLVKLSTWENSSKLSLLISKHDLLIEGCHKSVDRIIVKLWEDINCTTALK